MMAGECMRKRGRGKSKPHRFGVRGGRRTSPAKGSRVKAYLRFMHLIALLPLAFFAQLGVFSVCGAITTFSTEAGEALVFVAIGLICTLAYPGLIDFERWFERRASIRAQDAERLPIVLYDAFFLGGGFIASWRLASRINPLESIGIAFALWIIAGTVARRRVADLDAAAAKQKS
jgi:hypothetical protein